MIPSHIVSTMILSFVSILGAKASTNQTWGIIEEIKNGGGEGLSDLGDFFGYSVAIDGDIAAVGALYSDSNGTDDNIGAVYAFEWGGNGWNMEAKIMLDDIVDGEYCENLTSLTGSLFGFSVAISGDTIIAGAPNCKAAFAFVREDGGNWTQQAVLLGNDTSTEYYGRSVDIYGDVAIVGTYGFSDKGSAAVFVRDVDGNWTLSAELDEVGACALGNNTILIGSSVDDEMGKYSGAAFVYSYDGEEWTQEVKILPDDESTEWWQFGTSVALSGDGNTALIGATSEKHDTQYGSAYVYVRSGSNWTLQGKLVGSFDVAEGGGDNFGYSVSLSDSGDTAVVGAFSQNSISDIDGGFIYIYSRDGDSWAQNAAFGQSTDQTGNSMGDSFGWSVAISGDKIVIGGPFFDDAEYYGKTNGIAYYIGLEDTVANSTAPTTSPTSGNNGRRMLRGN